jgi:hypothetical protein
MQEFALKTRNPLHFGPRLAISSGKIPPTLSRYLKDNGQNWGFTMGLLFAAPAVSFVAIFAIALRNQFAAQTDL